MAHAPAAGERANVSAAPSTTSEVLRHPTPSERHGVIRRADAGIVHPAFAFGGSERGGAYERKRY